MRFIAAALIVLYHSRGQIGIHSHWAADFKFDHGVSFFFVLSGFILVLVYPNLKTRRESYHFILKRAGRIWPSHFASILLLLLLFPNLWQEAGLLQVLTNVFMIHAWVPLPTFFFGLNPPSWSISTEFFFYLCFPFLICHLKSGRLRILSFSLSLLVILNFVVQTMGLSFYQPDVDTLSVDALLYIHPFARLFEFILGMCAALVFQRIAKHKATYNKARDTTIEFATFGLAIVPMYYGWPYLCAAPLFGLLIIVIALERGLFSEFLSCRVPLILGEISYPVYLVHAILIRCYQNHKTVFATIPDWFAYLIFWSALLIVSYLIHLAIEKPCRNFVSRWSTQKLASEYEAANKIWRPYVIKSKVSRLSFKTVLFTASILIASLFILLAANRTSFFR